MKISVNDLQNWQGIRYFTVLSISSTMKAGRAEYVSLGIQMLVFGV
jgi:hypothetical protein